MLFCDKYLTQLDINYLNGEDVKSSCECGYKELDVLGRTKEIMTLRKINIVKLLPELIGKESCGSGMALVDLYCKEPEVDYVYEVYISKGSLEGEKKYIHNISNFGSCFRRVDDRNNIIILIDHYPHTEIWPEEEVEIEYLYYNVIIENMIHSCVN
jgi:hypothetical protein